MGNLSSTSNRVVGIPSEAIALKSGDRQRPDKENVEEDISFAVIHCPLQSSHASYRSLFNDVDFKSFILGNLDSRALITSILQNAEEEELV